MSKLKRCPCCKGEAKIIHNHDSFTDTYGAYIECQECGLRTKEIDTTLKFGQHIPSYNPIDFLIKTWNTRKPMQNDETIEIVKLEFDDMKGHLDNVLNALLSEKETELSGIYNSQIEHMIAQDRMEYKNEIINDVIDIIKREFLL